MRQAVKDERLRMALSFHPLFIGGDPLHVTSMYALVSHLEKEFGVHYAMGGVQAIADAMARRREQGGLSAWRPRPTRSCRGRPGARRAPADGEVCGRGRRLERRCGPHLRPAAAQPPQAALVRPS
jgi:hypothetical protein